MKPNSSEDAPLSPLLRVTNLLVAIVLVAGASLFFVPDLLGPRWPWQIAPFNMHFLAAIYLSELVAVGMMIATNKWVPVRLVLPMAIAFTIIVTAMSFLYLNRFDATRPTTWAWFVLYIVPMLVLSYFFWQYRVLPAPDAAAPSPLRAYLLGQGAVLLAYGVALLVAPNPFGNFWPWAIDDFHARVYSAIFIASSIGSLILSRRGAPLEYLTMGLSQGAIGLFSILGLLIVDASTHRVDWTQMGTLVWIAGFGVLLLAGLVLVLSVRRMPSRIRTAAEISG